MGRKKHREYTPLPSPSTSSSSEYESQSSEEIVRRHHSRKRLRSSDDRSSRREKERRRERNERKEREKKDRKKRKSIEKKKKKRKKHSLNMAASPSSVPFVGIRDEDQSLMKQHHSSTPTSSSAPAPQTQKKKRNQPGTPNPDAEVIALSPKTLMATNRFICEVCNKGFQREQNLQLHRRGHNLPWKLKQKTTKEVKKKVYLCPEPTCVHHDPSRALGDLTGIKKHYSRKHGEKKWKCHKCSKRYAVQSDWKAHSKTCGTREYRCDCGTLFSRRDSFITHRAFCDALAQESARNPSHSMNTIGSHLYGNSKMSISLSQVGSQISSIQGHGNRSSDILRLGGGTGTGQFDHLLPPSIGSSSFQPQQDLPSSAFFMQESNHNYHDEHQSSRGLLQNKPYPHGLMQIADLHNNPTSNANLFNLGFLSSGSSTSSIANNNNQNSSNTNLAPSGLLISNHFNHQNGIGGSNIEGSNIFPNSSMMGDQMNPGASPLFNPSLRNDNVLPHTSATALLQKAAQLGSTSSNASLLRSFGNSSSNATKSERPLVPENFGDGIFGDNDGNLHDLMSSFATGNSSIFGSAGHATENPYAAAGYNGKGRNFGHMGEATKLNQSVNMAIGGSDRLTRDFLGVGQVVRSMSGGFSQQREKQQQQRGMDMASASSLDSERKIAAAPTSQSFGGDGNFR
uniref:C2H2-type domain-containing protein n=1 Tax=Rhizophora mucronata TaxID=61149 RepID=A0A2P2LXS3_RHIMU